MIVEKNGRLYGKGTGLGGSAVVNPNIFYSGDNSINIIIREPKCILDK